jgi:uncharacterized membrane protein (GlpM family)
MQKNYMLVYTTKLQPEAIFSEVAEKLSLAFKISQDAAEKILASTKPKPIKKGLPYEMAEKYKTQFNDIGLLMEIVEEASASEPLPSAEKIEENNMLKEETSPYTPPKSDLKQGVESKPGMIGLFVRFIVFYVLFGVVISFVVSVIGRTNSSIGSTLIIIFSTSGAITHFAKKHKRNLTQNERIKATIGFSIINVLIQMGLTVLLLSMLAKPVSLTVLLVILGVTIVVHTAGIYFTIWCTLRGLVKKGEIPAKA